MTFQVPASSSEDEQQKVKAGEMLLESLRKIDALGDSVTKFRVQPSSSLAGDDKATGYETLSSQVETNIQGAIDNVRALSALILGANMLPAYAHFGLLRNALEMTGLGFWLLGPSARDERVLRSLQAALESERDAFIASNELKGNPAKFVADNPVQLILQSQRDARANLIGRTLNAPSISARLKVAQEYCEPLPYTILGFWRITSGAMHGRRTVLKELLQHEIVEASEEGGVRANASSGIIVVANILRHVEIYLFQLTFLLLRRGGHGG